MLISSSITFNIINFYYYFQVLYYCLLSCSILSYRNLNHVKFYWFISVLFNLLLFLCCLKLFYCKIPTNWALQHLFVTNHRKFFWNVSLDFSYCLKIFNPRLLLTLKLVSCNLFLTLGLKIFFFLFLQQANKDLQYSQLNSCTWTMDELWVRLKSPSLIFQLRILKSKIFLIFTSKV